MSIKKFMSIIENAEFDRKDAKTITYGNSDFQDYGSTNIKTRHHAPARYADNALDDEQLNEFAGDDASSLEALHHIFQNADISDTEIKNGISLTLAGKQKIAGRLGIAASEVQVLIASLITKLKKEEIDLRSSYDAFMTEDEDSSTARYSYESDMNGNVTIRDSQSGKQVYLQGSQASQLLTRIQANSGNTQNILAGYQSMMEAKNSSGRFLENAEISDVFPEIASDVGTFNFPWKVDGESGFGTAEFSGTPNHPVINVIHVTDMSGDKIDVDDALKEKLTTIAHDFMGKV